MTSPFKLGGTYKLRSYSNEEWKLTHQYGDGCWVAVQINGCGKGICIYRLDGTIEGSPSLDLVPRTKEVTRWYIVHHYGGFASETKARESCGEPSPGYHIIDHTFTVPDDEGSDGK